MKKEMKKSGFTLVEIMIVVMIIGLLAAIGIPSFQKARSNTMKKNAINNARICLDAAQQYSMEKGLAKGTEVTSDQYIPYVKGGEAGLKVGAVTAVVDPINPDDDALTAASLAKDSMYPSLDWD